jgi:hypothetical protein
VKRLVVLALLALTGCETLSDACQQHQGACVVVVAALGVGLAAAAGGGKHSRCGGGL